MTPPRDDYQFVIIGAGPTGLGAAWRLQELGIQNFVVLEAASGPGGLAASVRDQAGFTWDLGGHVQFSHYAYYDRVLDCVLRDQWLWHTRESWVWFKGRFVPYPFQYNIDHLDPADRERILAGLRQAQARAGGAPSPSNFREWIDQTFGEGLASLFMYPYNRKVWGYPLEQLAWHWIGDRVAVPNVARIARNVSTNRNNSSWGPNATFRYPLYGGTGAIWKGVASRLRPERLRFHCRVTGIDIENREVRLENGGSIHYNVLVSSMPLDILLGLCDPLPEAMRQAQAAFRHSSVHILGIGLRGGKPASLAQKCWLYFPEDHSPYYRVTVFCHYSPHNVPEGDGIWSLMAEVCEPFVKPRLDVRQRVDSRSNALPMQADSPVDETKLKAWTLQALRTDRLIEQDAEVLSFWHTRLEHGYPTPFLERDQVLSIVNPALEARCIFARGRFGAWKYEVSNQDHSFMQGVELVNRLIRGEPEITYCDPARANSGIFRNTT